MAPPIVTSITQYIYLNQAIAATELFTVTDPDGDPVTRYRFADLSSSFLTGFFRLNGSPYANGTDFTVSAAEISGLEFVAGSSVGQETLRISARDLGGWGNTIQFNVFFVQDNLLSRPEISSVGSYLLLENESVALSTLFSATDPDGWPIRTFYIRDQKFGDNSGFISTEIDGPLTQSVAHYLPDSKFATALYNGVSPNEVERLFSFAWDGALWSTVGTVDIQMRPNTSRPVAHFGRKSVIADLTSNVSSAFNFFDADGNTMKQYQVWDTNGHAHSGNLKIGNQLLGSKQWITIDAEDMAGLQYVSPTVGMSETFRFRAFDGKYWSAINDVVITTLERPELEFEPLRHGEDLRTFRVANNFFSKADSGPAYTTYEIYEAPGRPNTSGRLQLNGALLPEGQVHSFTPQQFAQLNFRSGRYGDRELDTFTFRVSNGTVWSPWEKMEYRTEPVYRTALRVPNGSFDNTWLDWNDFGQTPEITFSFMMDWTDHESADGAAADQFTAFTAAQRSGAREAFSYLSELINVRFEEVSDLVSGPGGRGGVIRMGNYNNPPPDVGSGEAAAYAFFPADVVESPSGGDIWVNRAFVSGTQGWSAGGQAYFVFIHELGHAMGLPHTFAIPGGILPPPTENNRYSVMSYTSGGALPAGYMLYDLLAMQDLYGANNSTRTGNDVYSITGFFGENAAAPVFYAIWDAGGNDTLSAEDTINASGAIIDLRQGSLSSIGSATQNIAVGFHVDIENATGSNFSDTLIGNHLDNVMMGLAGNDTIRGGAGDDQLFGGTGNDTYLYDLADGFDTIDEQRTGGLDRIELGDFPTLNSIADLSFRREFRDLVIDLTFGTELSEGSIRIKDQRWGGSRVETLNINGVDVDLVSLYDLATDVNKQFALTTNTNSYGFIAAPV